MPEYVPRCTPKNSDIPDDDLTICEMVRPYLDTAEWCDINPIVQDDDSGESGREAFADAESPKWTPEAIATATATCCGFLSDLSAAAREAVEADPHRAGGDLRLTASGHGAGFWDGGWLDAVSRELTDTARPYGDNGVYFNPDAETLSLE